MTRLPLLGGLLCLDFVNTIDPRHRPPKLEYLQDYDGLLDWAVHAQALTVAGARDLAVLARRHPTKARRVHARAISLREALYPTLAPATRADPCNGSLAIINAELRQAMSAVTVEPAPGGPGAYRLGRVRTDQLDHPLWPVVRSAADLLTSASLGRVAECDGQGCGWLFLDTSKAGRRRWCSMAICGNRAKARRHAQRAAGRGPRASQATSGGA